MPAFCLRLYTLPLPTPESRQGLLPRALTNGAKVLTFAAGTMFGSAGEAILGVIFFIACLNTCVGLLSCCSEFFCQLIPVLKYRMWVLLFAAVSVVVANAGLTRILALSTPVLNAIYPVAIMLIFLSFLKTATSGMYRLGVLFTGIVSVFYAAWGRRDRYPGSK